MAPSRKKGLEEDDHATVRIIVGDLRRSLAIPCPTQEALVDGLINRGEIVMIAARPGTGKTPLIAQLMSAVASGTPFLDLPTAPCRVLLIDVESQPHDYRTMLDRQWRTLNLDVARVTGSIDMFARGIPQDPNSEELGRILGCRNEVRWEWVENLVEQGQYGLVVVDTVLTFAPFKSGDEDKARELFAAISALCRKGSRPAFLGSLHLRKRDRKGKIPTLLEDPTGWTEEILGSIVWSANADVRLGLERVDDNCVALAGYRRGRGEFVPLIIQERRDEHGEPVAWEQCSNDALATQVLTADQHRYFKEIPVGKELTWEQLREYSGAPKSTLSRIKAVAIRAGLLEHDEARRVFRRLR